MSGTVPAGTPVSATLVSHRRTFSACVVPFQLMRTSSLGKRLVRTLGGDPDGTPA